MPFPSTSLGLVPWMNGRIDAGPGNALPWETTKSFDPNTTITFQWIEDGSWTNPSVTIYAHDRWGNTNINHEPVIVGIDAAPGSVNHTPANRTALFAIPPVGGETAQLSDDNSYWIVSGGRWIRMVVQTNAGTVSAYGVTATVFNITISQSDLPQLNGIGLLPGYYYDLCWETNSLHAPQYDASFNVRPQGPRQGLPVTHCALCGIRLKKTRLQFFWPNGKPKCAMQ